MFNVHPRSHRFTDVKSHFTVRQTCLGFRSVLIGAQLLTTACDTTVITEESLSPNKSEPFTREFLLAGKIQLVV